MDGDDIPEQQDSDTAAKDHVGGGDADHMDSHAPAFTGNKREFESRRSQLKNADSGDGIAIEDASENSHSDRENLAPQEERYIHIHYQFQMDL